MNNSTNIKILVDVSPNMGEFVTAGVRKMMTAIKESLHERGACLIALAGGQTPYPVYQRLGDWLISESLDLKNVHFIFTDERMVPPEDSESNFGMAHDAFLSRIPIPPMNIHRIKGEVKADVAARDYAQELQTLLPHFASRCDLVLLGVGEDGHTASLFPGMDILDETEETARAVFVPKMGGWRVTLTLPFINRAREVVFLVTGPRKASILKEIFSFTEPQPDLPATLIQPYGGAVTWMMDAEAATQLQAGDPGQAAGETGRQHERQ
ncbi:MAG: 6-phosphogluconolactonase [Candidatus Omnitrophota bacterium]